MTLTELIEKIKVFEGFRNLAYDDLQPSKTITDISQLKGTLTIGYGRTSNVSIGEWTTKEKENAWIVDHVTSIYKTVSREMKKYYTDVTENQILALTDFTYNCGRANFLKITDTYNRTLKEIGNKLPEYCKSKGQTLKGLQVRREFEKQLFFDYVSCETLEPDTPHYTEKNIQVLCNKIIRDYPEKYNELFPLSEDGILGQKSLDTIFTLLYLGHNYY